MFQPLNDERHLVYPVYMLLLGTGGFVISGFLAIVSVANTPPDMANPVASALVFSILALLSLTMLIMYLRRRFVVSEEGVRYQCLLGGWGYFKWSDITKVQYSLSGAAFILQLPKWNYVAISQSLSGQREFARLLLENVPLRLIEEGALSKLRKAADKE